MKSPLKNKIINHIWHLVWYHYHTWNKASTMFNTSWTQEKWKTKLTHHETQAKYHFELL